jgi:hypothetical protein
MKIVRRALPGAPIVVHLDVFQTPFDSSLFAGMPDIHVMTSDSPIIWGDIDLETVRWRVFRWTLENLDFDWLIMLSEQDYPIAPLRNLENRLATSDAGADAIVGGVAIEKIKDKRLRREMNAPKISHESTVFLLTPVSGRSRDHLRRFGTDEKIENTAIARFHTITPPTAAASCGRRCAGTSSIRIDFNV